MSRRGAPRARWPLVRRGAARLGARRAAGAAAAARRRRLRAGLGGRRVQAVSVRTALGALLGHKPRERSRSRSRSRSSRAPPGLLPRRPCLSLLLAALGPLRLALARRALALVRLARARVLRGAFGAPRSFRTTPAPAPTPAPARVARAREVCEAHRPATPHAVSRARAARPPAQRARAARPRSGGGGGPNRSISGTRSAPAAIASTRRSTPAASMGSACRIASSSSANDWTPPQPARASPRAPPDAPGSAANGAQSPSPARRQRGVWRGAEWHLGEVFYVPLAEPAIARRARLALVRGLCGGSAVFFARELRRLARERRRRVGQPRRAAALAPPRLLVRRREPRATDGTRAPPEHRGLQRGREPRAVPAVALIVAAGGRRAERACEPPRDGERPLRKRRGLSVRAQVNRPLFVRARGGKSLMLQMVLTDRRAVSARLGALPPPSPRTNWTRLISPPVLTGHVSSPPGA
jgi:hypothetical protein